MSSAGSQPEVEREDEDHLTLRLSFNSEEDL